MRAKKYLDVVSQAVKGAGVTCDTTTIEHEHPCQGIRDTAKKGECDLIVIAVELGLDFGIVDWRRTNGEWPPPRTIIDYAAEGFSRGFAAFAHDCCWQILLQKSVAESR